MRIWCVLALAAWPLAACAAAGEAIAVGSQVAPSIDGDPGGELSRCEATGGSTAECCASHPSVPACRSISTHP
jgi:hypothetical protein